MASTDEESEAGVQAATKKRKGNPKLWKTSVAKKKRDSGEAYVSAYTNKQMPARRVGPDCKCPKKCYEKIGMACIQEIFDNYWVLADHSAQTAYLTKLVHCETVNRSEVGEGSRRKNTNVYTVFVAGILVNVCLIAFTNIHGISETRVRKAMKKVTETGTVSCDQRGKQAPTNKTSDEIRDLVHQHVRSLPTKPSHYSRAKGIHRVYLPPGSSQTTLYKDYIRWLGEEGKLHLKATKWVYSSIFKSYNIGIEPPNSDTCNTCDERKIDIKRAKVAGDHGEVSRLQITLDFHLARARAAHRMLKRYAENQEDNVAALSIDLQQQLPTPRLTTNVQFYKHKLWTFNFSVHDLKSGKGYFYLWNEAIAKKGSNEIASCLNHFVSNYLGGEIDTLRIFSDNCGGQNKNTNIVLFHLRQIHASRFKKISHVFLESGHSYLPCDRDFGFLEKKLKGVQVYSTPHYAQIMSTCRDVTPFTVIEMNHTHFLNYDVLQKFVTKSEFAGSGFKDAKVFEAKEDYKMGICVRPGYDDEMNPIVKIKFQKGKGNTLDSNFDLSKVDLPLKYPNGVKLKPAKIKDIKYLCKFIKSGFEQFYADLFTAQDQIPDQGGAGQDGPDDPDEM